MTLVKICGLTQPADAGFAAEAGADYLGLVFAPSPRRIDLGTASRLRDATRGGPPRVGVFVDPEPTFLAEAIEAGGLALVQLHGDESPAFCAALELPVIKALRVGRDPVDECLTRYAASYFLADTYSADAAGGTGRSFDWEPARAWARRCRLFLAGGLTPDNVAAAIGQVEPHAVDVSSGVELAPGRKDLSAIGRFVAAVRAADQPAHRPTSGPAPKESS